MRLVFAASAALLAWTYLLFPGLLLVRGRLRHRPHRVAPIEPTVSVIIAAYNEATSIGERLRNLLEVDYPPNRLEIVVASDGSTDDTVAIVNEFAPRVRLLNLPRGGKGPALMAAVAASTGEILVFTDANTSYDPGAIRALVAHLADPDVGGVAGNQVYLPAGASSSSESSGSADARDARRQPTDDAVGERRYWDFDRLLKVAQSRSDSVVGATGAIYAIRRDLFTPIPFGVADDLSITFGVLAAGRRFVFAPEAIAYEPVAPDTGAEFVRKVRVVTRGLQCVVAWRELLDPRRHGFLALSVLSRKVLMRSMALPLACLLVSSVVGARRSRFRALVAGAQLVSYGLAAAGLAAPRSRLGRHPVAAIPAYVVMTQAASLVGLWNVALGRRGEGWQTARQIEDGAGAGGRRVTVEHDRDAAA